MRSGSRELAVELFADEEHGGFFRPGPRRAADARQKTSRTTDAVGNDARLLLLRLARIYGDAELERRAVGVFRLVGQALPRAPQFFGHALCALDLHFSPPRELAIVGPPDSEVARAALTPFDPNAVVAFGPAEGVPLLEGKGLVAANRRLRVRELRLSGAYNQAENLSKTLTNP